MSGVFDHRISTNYYIDAEGEMELEHNGRVYRFVKMLKDDKWAAVAMMECDGKRYVLKISRCRGWLERVMHPLMAFISRHEYELYRTCDGIAGVPPWGDRVSSTAYLHEYAEGVTLDQNDDVDEEFFDRLAETIQEIHGRDVAYVDLAKRENIIVGDDGRHYLIDFQISLRRSNGRGPFAWFQNLLVRTFQREDEDHILKHRDRILRGRVADYDQQYQKRRSRFANFHRRVLRRPYLFLKRLFVPKHGDTNFYR